MRLAAHISMACCLTLWISSLAAGQLSSDLIYDKSRILDVSIEMPEADWKQLCLQSRNARGVFAGKIEDPFTYFRGDITIDGVTIKSVGIRKKGFIGSLDDRFPSLKIKFDEFVDQRPIAELEGLTLNNNKQDTGLVSQTLAYELFNAAGVKAPRCTYAKVTVNGQALGIYSNVESIGKPFLKRNFKNDGGNLYEGTLADFYPRALDRIEVKTNKKNHDRTKLERMAKMLAEDEPLNIEQLGEIVDLDNFLRYWAVESLIGFWDSYSNNQNNYWIYENQENGKFYFMPWGADAAFMQSGFPAFGPPGPISVYAESMLSNRLIQNVSVAERYRDNMRWVLEHVWKEAELIARIDSIEQMLKGQTHSRQSGAPRAMQSVRQFINRRRKIIEQELDTWPVWVSPHPRKPMYVVPIGNVAGELTATWSDRPLRDISSAGGVNMKVTLDGQDIAFDSIGVSVHPAPRMGFPGFGPPMPPGPPMIEIAIEGVRTADSKLARFTISIPEQAFTEVEGKTLDVEGVYLPDTRARGFGMPFGGKSLAGTIAFSKLGRQVGDAVEAKFDLKLSEVRGGFMNRERVIPRR